MIIQRIQLRDCNGELVMEEFLSSRTLAQERMEKLQDDYKMDIERGDLSLKRNVIDVRED